MKPICFSLLVWSLSLSIALAQPPVIDSLRQSLAQTRSDTNRVLLLLDLASTYRFSKPDSALLLSKEALQLAQQLGFASGEIQAQNIRGETLGYLGELPQGLEAQFDALRISRRHHAKNEESNTLAFIGLIYVEMSEYRQGLNYLQQARQLNKRILEKETDKILVFTSQIMGSFIVSNIGYTYERMNKLDSAMFFQKQAYALSLSLNQPNLRPLILTRLGVVEARMGHFDQARNYYQQALHNAFLSGDLLNQGAIQYQLARLYHQRQLPDSSLYYARLAFANGQQLSQPKMVLDVSRLLVKLYHDQHQVDSAFHYQQVAIAANDSLFGPEKFQRLQLLTLTEQQLQQQLQEEQVRSQAHFQRIGLLSVLGVFLLIALLLWHNNRQQQRANRILNQQNHQIQTQRNDLQQTLSELKAAQTQLIQSEKMASLGELTAGIAHEIQNPLNFVNNFSEVSTELVNELEEEWAKEDRSPEMEKELLSDLKQNLSKIHHHGKRADAIVKGMMEHSRAGSGEKRLTDLNALAEEYLRLSYHGLRVKDKDFNASLVTDFDPSLGKTEVVPQEMGRVLLNLFNNAFYAVSQKKSQFNGQYQPEVKVSTKTVGNKVEIRVKDNGIGITDGVKQKIFQPFFTTKPTGEGTGLGLSLSYDIITKGHGGELKVDTQEGEFSEFIIRLPIK
jgi:signal transduction histidine kinase